MAIAQLNRALPPADAPDVAAASPGETPALMTGKQAAALTGVTESTLSRWRQSVPAWAEANPMLFRHLIDRDDGKHSRMNIRKLASWYAVAEEQGGQTAVDCP